MKYKCGVCGKNIEESIRGITRFKSVNVKCDEPKNNCIFYVCTECKKLSFNTVYANL